MSESKVKKKPHVCLICGIQTNLLLNIFEPRNGPNIVDVIYEKYKFRAERENTDKFICYSCNNWLVNWYSLQNKNDSPEQQQQPSTSSSKHKRSRGERFNNSMNNYKVEKGATQEIEEHEAEKENYDLNRRIVPVLHDSNHIPIENNLYIPRKKFKCFYCYKKFPNWNFKRQHIKYIHSHVKKEKLQELQSKLKCETTVPMNEKELDETIEVSSTSQRNNYLVNDVNQRNYNIVKCLDDKVILMLQKQGTLLIDEQEVQKMNKPEIKTPIRTGSKKNRNEIILSFNSVITECVPSFIDNLNDMEEGTQSINNIFKKIPKSLIISKTTQD